jgi:hypothetical protein
MWHQFGASVFLEICSMSEILRDRYGHKIGEVVIQGTKRILRDEYGRKLGDYDARDGMTRDVNGRLIGRSDLLLTLLQ